MARYSPAQLRAMDEINVRIEALEALAGELRSALRQCDVAQARVAAVPRPKKDAETERPERIEPDTLTGQAAFDRALFALTDWYGDEEHSSKAVARTPGAIVLRTSDANAADIETMVDQGNALKDQIKALLPQLGDRDTRFKILHDHHHMLVTLQLIRHWTALPPEPVIQSLRFTWGVKTEIRTVTVEQTLKKIEALRTEPPRGDLTPEQWDWTINKELAKVSALPGNTELRHRRELVVRPMVNIRLALTARQREERRRKYEQEGKFEQPVKLREAHTPLLVLNPKQPVTLGHLGTYDAQQRRQRKKRDGRRTAEEPVSWLTSIYPVR